MEITKDRKCRLAIDGHVLLQNEKTGVGRTAQYLIDELVKNKSFDIQINFVDLFGYRCRNLIKHYKKQGCRIKFCWWMPYSIYNKVFETLKIPYFFLFGRRNDLTLFFEYQVPYKVGTKVANYVYDVNYKVYSETVDHSTLVWLDKNLPIYCDRSDLILTISEFSKKQIEKYMKIKESKIQIVPCGVDCDKYKKLDIEKINFVKHKYGIAGDYILYMGTLEPRKNIVILIKAYYLMTQKKTNIPKLIIAGKRGWMYEQLFQKTLEYKLEDQIIFTGYIENDDCPVLMSGAELFVFPSLYEGFGIPPLEAMACGTPVIVSNADALLEAVGENAIYFCPMNAEELCKKINYLLENQDLREKLSFSGRKWAEKHTWKKAGEKLTAVLETV